MATETLRKLNNICLTNITSYWQQSQRTFTNLIISSQSSAAAVRINHASILNVPASQWLERLKDGKIHMCFFSDSGYRPFINPPPSLPNLLIDITLCSISFWCLFVLFFVNFRVRVTVGVSYRVRV